MKIFPIPIFSDNYVWALHAGTDAVVVDPGDAGPVQQALDARSLALRAILITHWHPDHIGGLAQLRAAHPVPVYGPQAEQARIPGLTRTLREGDQVEVLGQDFAVMEVPGHTLGHIAYHGGDTLLCGDTLFSAGCGRLFEGTPVQMHASLARLAALPDSTGVYCTHEYTLSNLAFARAAEPDNADLVLHLDRVRELRSRNQPSLPSTIGLEKRINPFLRCAEPGIVRSAGRAAGRALAHPGAVFAALRQWKDRFQPGVSAMP